MDKTLDRNSSRWVELAVLAPGQSHYWFFDPSWDAYGWVFQATAYPEPEGSGAPSAAEVSRVEVTELYVVRREAAHEGKCGSRVNITVTNCGDGWAPYSLWVAAASPRKIRVRPPSDRLHPRTVPQVRP
jgi:hypothetical protein